MLNQGYLCAAFALGPLLVPGKLGEDEVGGILTHVAVFLGLVNSDFNSLPDTWTCPVCDMPKKKFKRLGKKRRLFG
ncbi:MAG: rubredoxin [Thermoplasmata archaeon]|nr:MAG: rubredoxin [Thermoplasmata archaeon]